MSRRFLIQRQVDLALMGGLSLVLTAVFYFLRIRTGDLLPYALAILVLFSYPHFIASMKVFYSRKGAFREHPVVALWLPLAMAAFFIGVGYFVALSAFMLAAQLALLLLYWHFLKQAYGVSLWLGQVPGRRMSEPKKKLLLAGCMFFGAYGYMTLQESSGFSQIFQVVAVKNFHLEPWAVSLFEVLAYTSIAAFLLWSARDVLKERENADFQPAGWIPLAAMVTWFDPHFGGLPVLFLAPIFHALQYLPFPIREELNAHPAARSNPGWMLLYLSGLLAGGVLAFILLPKATAFLLPPSMKDFIFGGIAIFLNVHHYFIDSVIWKFRDPAILSRVAPEEAQLSAMLS